MTIMASLFRLGMPPEATIGRSRDKLICLIALQLDMTIGK